MNFSKILLISISVASDAFAVSVCKGICLKKINYKKIILIGLYFGFFQALMPTIGYFLSLTFKDLIIKIDHWIAFLLLSMIGVNLIKDSQKKENLDDKIDIKTMFLLAIATSIDALAIGITFAFFKINILSTVTLIGLITFILSMIGVVIGNQFGNRFESSSKVVGGVILIFIGLKILLEHLKIL